MAEKNLDLAARLRPALAGFEPYDPAFSPCRVNLSANENTHALPEEVRAAIDAAARTGTVRRIYYTSLAFAGDSGAAVMQADRETEAYLKTSGVPYTIVREGIYSESFPLYFGFWSADGGADEVLVPHSDGGIAWVSREDLGEGTARIMVDVSHSVSRFRDLRDDATACRAGTRTRQCCSLARASSPSRRSRRRYQRC